MLPPLTVKQLKQLVVQRLRRMQEEEVQAAKKDPLLQVARDSSFLDAPFTTMVPTFSWREVKRIKKGKYAHFETSLSHDDPGSSLPGGEQRKGKHQRSYVDTDAKSLTSAAGWRRGISLSPPGSRLALELVNWIPVHLPAVLSVLRRGIPEVRQALQAS